jgi:acetylornithine deacetylase
MSTNSSPKFEDALRQLIAEPSISSTQTEIDMGNSGVTDLLANWLDAQGFDVELQPISESGSKVNLYATIGANKETDEGKGGLVFSGHTDTVPCDPDLWDGQPFALQKNSFGYQGLGATDMKGFFAVLLQTLGQLDLDKLKKPLTIVATADEETTMSGARALLREKVASAEAVIIGEPTDLKPIRMHKGIMMESIRVQGIGGHSSDPELGLNAMEVMYEVLGGLLSLRRQLQQEYQHSGFAVCVPTLNPGCIHGGDNPNRICSHCEIEFDVRTLPGMLSNRLRAQIDEMNEPIANKWNCSIERQTLLQGIESFEQHQDSNLVRLAEQLSNTSSSAVSFATEAPFYKDFGLETLVMGPGSIDQAHAINEYLPGDQIDPAIEIYTSLINNYCFR